MGKTILLARWILRLSVSWTWCFWIHFCFLHILYQTLNFPFPSLASLLSCHIAQSPADLQDLGDWATVNLVASHLAFYLFFFSVFIPEGLSEACGNKAADLRDSPRRRERTDVPRRRGSDASNSWSRWQILGRVTHPAECRREPQEQRLHVIYFWLPGLPFIYLSSTKGKAKLCLKWQASWSTFQLFLVCTSLHLP